MQSPVTKVTRVKEVALPPGNYRGNWCGYVITLTMENGEWQLHTRDGMRGVVGCTVTVDDVGFITVERDT